MTAFDEFSAWFLLSSFAVAVVAGLLPAMATFAMKDSAREKKIFRFGMIVAVTGGSAFVVWLFVMGFVHLIARIG